MASSRRPLLFLLLPLLLVAALPFPLHAQQAAATATERTVDSPSPDGRFAFLAINQPEEEPQKTYDLIEKSSGKVLLRVAQSDEGKDRLGTTVLWSADSERFALCATYNHFGAELSVYLLRGGAFRKIDLPELETAEVPARLKPGHFDWKTTNINSQEAKRWQKDGSLIVGIESAIAAINGGMYVTSERTVVLGFDGKAGAAKILKSTQKATLEKK